MYKVIISVILCGVTFVMAACSEKKVEPVKKQDTVSAKMSVHGDLSKQTDSVGLDEIVKKNTLPGFPPVPLGKAFSNYTHFTKQEWKETRVANGKSYIDCIGWLDTKKLDVATIKNGISMQGVQFKFVITNEGAFGLSMVSRVEAKTDGNLYFYPLADVKGVMEKIYDNKEIHF